MFFKIICNKDIYDEMENILFIGSILKKQTNNYVFDLKNNECCFKIEIFGEDSN